MAQETWLWAPSTELREAVEKFAPAPWSVLIVGERGSGKSSLAREIHRRSGRKGAFVFESAPAFAESLEQAELSGHAQGSFTGAHRDRKGLIESAHGGTFFLDELGAARLALQQKLLNYFNGSPSVRRLGEERRRQVDVRFIAATNEDLSAAVAEGRFRQDLLDRFGWFVLSVPPLRSRRSEILLFADAFLESAALELGRPIVRLSRAVREHFRKASWPGNVRHLEKVCQWIALCASPGRPFEIHELPEGICEASTPLTVGYRGILTAEVAEAAVNRFGGNVTRAAASLGCDRRQIQRLRRGRGTRPN